MDKGGWCMMPFATSKAKIILSQDDIAKAVEFWLNEKIMRLPCKIAGMVESRVNDRSTFEVEFQMTEKEIV
jgi:hypothetical protein